MTMVTPKKLERAEVTVDTDWCPARAFPSVRYLEVLTVWFFLADANVCR